MNSRELIDQADRRYREIGGLSRGWGQGSWCNGYIQGWMEHTPDLRLAALERENETLRAKKAQKQMIADGYRENYREVKRRAEALEAGRASLCDAINTEARECHSPEAEQPTMHRMKNTVRLIVDKLRSERTALEAECGRLRELEWAARDLVHAVNETAYETAWQKLENAIAALAPQAPPQEKEGKE